MSDVASVNEEKPVPSDSEAAGLPWVDEVFRDQNPERLPDEPEPTPEEIAAAEAEKAAAEEAERKANGTPTKAELKAMLDALPDDDEGEQPVGEEPDEAAEEAKKKAAKAKEDEEEEEGAEEAKDEGKKPRRRSKARRERRAMERALAEKDAEIARLKEHGPERPEAEEAIPQPKLEDFEYDTEKWAEALGDWTKKQIDAGKEQAAKAEEAKRQEAEQAAIRERFEAFEDREDEFREQHDDYDDVTRADDLKITPDMAIFIQESELGPHIAYHLGNNPEEADEIAGLSPLAQIKRLTRIEARLEAEQAADAPQEEEAEEAEGAGQATNKPTQPAAKAPQRSPTQAPEPISTVGGGGSPPRRDPSKMPYEEYRQGRLTGKIR